VIACPGWGLSEAGLVAAIPFELGVGVGEKKAGSVGVPLHNTHLKVLYRIFISKVNN